MGLVVVVPTVRPAQYAEFTAAWSRILAYHRAIVVAVIDDDEPELEVDGRRLGLAENLVDPADRDLFCNRSDSCRNYGFYYAAKYLDFDAVVTLDDDVRPLPGRDAVVEHLAVLRKQVPLSWMNSGCGEPYYRGVPYGVRDEAVVHVSHGVWSGVPDLDGPSQLYLTGKIDPDPPFWVGPVPRGVLFPFCGMSVACTRESLPSLYYTPMGPTTPFNRFGDIWLGVALKREFDARDWAIYTGASGVHHSRASDVYANLRAEADGLRVNERWWKDGDGVHPYFADLSAKRARYATVVSRLLGLPTTAIDDTDPA